MMKIKKTALYQRWRKTRGKLRNIKHKCKRICSIPMLKSLECKEDSPRYIVTLTSYGKRLTNTVPYAIISLLDQTIRPDKIVLWVGHQDKENISKILKMLTKKGVEICFCEDLKSYKKLVPAIDAFPNDYLITADDDIYYPRNWFEQLLTEHKKNPEKIICHRAHGIKTDENHNPLPYNDWDYEINSETAQQSPYSVFPTGGCGVLYPPKCFHNEITNKELFMKLAPNADDIWFWAMIQINYLSDTESPYIVVKNGYSSNLSIDSTLQGEDALSFYNTTHDGNDKQLKAVIEHFPQIREMLKKLHI